VDREHFYQLPQPIDKYPYLRWIVDSRLRRYIQQRIPEHFSPSEVLEIAKLLVSEVCQLAPLDPEKPAPFPKGESDLRGCIVAFLAHIIFRHPTMRRSMEIQIRDIVESLQLHGQSEDITDIYNTILMFLFNPFYLLKKFNPGLDWYDSLSRHVRRNFKNWLLDELRSLLKDQKFGRTNLGLLNRYDIKEPLRCAGEQGDRFSGLVLLHECCQELVKAEQFIINKPQSAHYDKLLARYRERSVGVNFEIVDREQIIELLQYLGNTVRNHNQLKTISSQFKVSDEETIDLCEREKDPKQTNVLEDLEKSEIQELAFKLLDKHEIDCKLLLFLDGLNLTQKEAGVEVDSTQYTISRTKIPGLLGKLARELHAIDPHSSLAQGSISKIIEEYINYLEFICKNYYYPELLSRILTEIVESASSGSNIERLFIDRLETQWQFKFKPDGVGASKAAEFVQRRLNLPSFYPDELPM
jgi:hypothetical protein